jgi:hypothetical protein
VVILKILVYDFFNCFNFNYSFCAVYFCLNVCVGCLRIFHNSMCYYIFIINWWNFHYSALTLFTLATELQKRVAGHLAIEEKDLSSRATG